MPVNKSALLRYRIIDGCLTNRQKRYPDMQYIIEKIEEQLDTTISESMFSKDIQQMKRIYNAPIKYDRYNNGYCYTEDEFSIAEFPLTHDEIEALDYSTALFHQLKGTRLFQQFENAINKVIEGYRISKALGKSEMQILQVEEPLKPENHWLEQILKAIVEKNVIAITYQGFGKPEKEHELSPYLLKEYRNRWYVVGYTHTTEQVLVFSLDRIKNVSASKTKYKSDDTFLPEDFFRYSFGITQLHNAKPEKVLLSFTAITAPYIHSQPLHHSQKVVSQTDEELQIEMEVYITPELKMSILSYGDQVKVLKPNALQKEIAETLGNTLKHYQ
jgi:predicted DNA-binding transcriptional regulator YafY